MEESYENEYEKIKNQIEKLETEKNSLSDKLGNNEVIDKRYKEIEIELIQLKERLEDVYFHIDNKNNEEWEKDMRNNMYDTEDKDFDDDSMYDAD